MKIEILSGTVSVGKPYLRCSTPECDAKGLSVVKLLTGVRDGDVGVSLKLQVARQAAEQSYGKAQISLKERPAGPELERTKVRRLSLEVEEAAKAFAEEQRSQASQDLSDRKAGDEVIIILEADGGLVRTGELYALKPGEPGYGDKTPARQLDRRRRRTGYREVITFDARELGTKKAAADAMVTVIAPPGEKSRRMRGVAVRAGYTEDALIAGLGDMGSGLARAFDIAFDGAGSWGADKHHTWDYVKNAAAVIDGIDSEKWATEMRGAIWLRDEVLRDHLLAQAVKHRCPEVASADPREREPLHALRTYLNNNWEYIRFEELESIGVPTVSARAESQVRDRTKARFSVPGAWKLENIEGKAVLRSIIFEGSFPEFAQWLCQRTHQTFVATLRQRLEQAVHDNRLSADRADLLLCPSLTVNEMLNMLTNERNEFLPRPEADAPLAVAA